MLAQYSTLWHCVASDQLFWEHWEEESLLFDSRSGQTHSLTPLATEVVLLLKQHNLSADDIATRLNNMFAEQNTKTVPDEIAVLLEHFDTLGLIEECPQQPSAN